MLTRAQRRERDTNFLVVRSETDTLARGLPVYQVTFPYGIEGDVFEEMNRVLLYFRDNVMNPLNIPLQTPINLRLYEIDERYRQNEIPFDLTTPFNRLTARNLVGLDGERSDIYSSDSVIAQATSINRYNLKHSL